MAVDMAGAWPRTCHMRHMRELCGVCVTKVNRVKFQKVATTDLQWCIIT